MADGPLNTIADLRDGGTFPPILHGVFAGAPLLLSFGAAGPKDREEERVFRVNARPM